MVNASPLLLFGFLLTVAIVVVGFLGMLVYTQRRHPTATGSNRVMLVVAGWLVVTGLLAAMELLHFDTIPPTAALLFFVGLGLTIALSRSAVGQRLAETLPLAALVGFQAFRIPVELLIHRAYSEGIAPVQLTYEGLNFDIISGVTAGLLGLWLLAREAPRWLLFAWNVIALLLLINVVTVALLSAPTPLQVFESDPPNVWISQWPWVWLPTILVAAALLFHLLLFRRLRMAVPAEA